MCDKGALAHQGSARDRHTAVRVIIGVLLLSGCAAAPPMTPASSPAVTAGASSSPRSTSAASSLHSPAPEISAAPELPTVEPLPTPTEPLPSPALPTLPPVQSPHPRH